MQPIPVPTDSLVLILHTTSYTNSNKLIVLNVKNTTNYPTERKGNIHKRRIPK